MTKFIFLFLALTSLAFGKGLERHPVDTIKWGSAVGSTISFTYDLNLASNPGMDVTSGRFHFTKPLFEVGDASANDVCFLATQAVSVSYPNNASFPELCYNKAGQKWKGRNGSTTLLDLFFAPASPAKGTILVFDGSNWANLGVGTDGYVVTASSADTKGVIWAAASGGGGGGTSMLSSEYVSFPMSVTATSSNPTKGTATFDLAVWKRVGDEMCVIYNYFQPGATGSAGSGEYLFNLPSVCGGGGSSQCNFDTAKVQFSTATDTTELGDGVLGIAAQRDSGGNRDCYMKIHNSQAVKMVCGATTKIGSATGSYGNSSLHYGFRYCGPISGWHLNSGS